jgi:hypothetical protein
LTPDRQGADGLWRVSSGTSPPRRQLVKAPVSAAARTDGPMVYVALGDSISIDHYAGGEGRGGASLFARNRDDVPQWRGRDLATLDPRLS